MKSNSRSTRSLCRCAIWSRRPPAGWSSNGEPSTNTIHWMADQLDRAWETYGHTAGGLVYSLNPLDQARLLAVQFHQLVLKASEAGIPLVFPVFPKSRPTGNISTNACDRSCRRRLPKTRLAPPTPESRTRRRFGSRAKFSRIRQATSSTEREPSPGRNTRARPKSTTSRFGAKSAGFASNCQQRGTVGGKPKFLSCAMRSSNSNASGLFSKR